MLRVAGGGSRRGLCRGLRLLRCVKEGMGRPMLKLDCRDQYFVGLEVATYLHFAEYGGHIY